MLVIPQVNVIRTTDALIETSQMISALGTKLQTRINTAGSEGGNVSALNTLMADLVSKISDAQIKAQSASTVVSTLKPDQGDQATITANKQAFSTARADLKVARTDLGTARTDAQKIINALKDMKVSAGATASTTVGKK